MIARWGLLAVGTILALSSGNRLQAQETIMLESRGGLTVRFVTRPQPAATVATTRSQPAQSVSTTPSPATVPISSTRLVTNAATPVITTKLTTVTTRQDPQQPALAPSPQPAQSQPSAPSASTQLQANVFGSGSVPSSQLAQERRSRSAGPSADLVMGRESGFRATSDAGSLLGKTNQTRGVAAQRRTPIITDTRVRGAGVGSLTVGG